MDTGVFINIKKENFIKNANDYIKENKLTFIQKYNCSNGIIFYINNYKHYIDINYLDYTNFEMIFKNDV